MTFRVDAPSMPAMQMPLWIAVAIHLVCITACGFIAGAGWWPLPQAAWPWVEGVGAAVIGMAVGLPRWWMPINLLFFPAGYLLLGLAVPPPVFLGMFCLLLLANGAAWFQRVPLFLSSSRAAAIVLTLLPRQGGFRFIDLGSGTGSLLTSLVRQRPDGHYTGIELAPLPFLLSRWRALHESAINVRWGDFWGTDLADYDVVYAYLSPAPMVRLWEKVRREMRPGSLFVSNGFSIPGAPPARTIRVGDTVRSTLYVWHM